MTRWNAMIRRRRAKRTLVSFASTLAVVLSNAGCLLHDQTQYFAVRDPDTGAANYYRMKVSGWGGFGTDYHMQAGYFSAAAVDILRGTMPKVPSLDLPIEQIEIFDRLTQQFFGGLVQEAKRVAPVTDPEALFIAVSSRFNVAKEQVDEQSAERDLLQSRLTSAIEAVTASTAAVTASTTRLDGLRTEVDAATQARVGLEAEERVKRSENGVLERGFKALDEAFLAAKQRAADLPDGAEKDAATQDAEQRKADRDAAEVSLRAKGSELANTVISLLGAKNTEKRAREALTVEESELRLAKSNLAAARRAERSLTFDLTLVKARLTHQSSAADAAERYRAKILEKFGDEVYGFSTDQPVVPAMSMRDFEEQTKHLARLIWFGSLSASDIASIGMTQTTDEYRFRKLVFWANAKNVDLNQLAAELDGIMENVVNIGLSFKRIGKEREAAKLADKQRQGLQQHGALEVLKRLAPEKAAEIEALMGILKPQLPAETKSPFSP